MTDLGAAGADAGLEVSPPSPPVRAFAPTPGQPENLLRQLSADSSSIRFAGVNRLARSLHAPFLVEPLIALLEDDNRGVRRAALSVLGMSGDARAVGPLRVLMKGNGRCARTRDARSGSSRAASPDAATMRETPTPRRRPRQRARSGRRSSPAS